MLLQGFINSTSMLKLFLTIIISGVGGYFFGLGLSGVKRDNHLTIVSGGFCITYALFAFSTLFVNAVANFINFTIPTLVVLIASTIISYYFYSNIEQRQSLVRALKRLTFISVLIVVAIAAGVLIRLNNEKYWVMFIQNNIGKFIFAIAFGIFAGLFFGEAIHSKHRKSQFKLWATITFIFMLCIYLSPIFAAGIRAIQGKTVRFSSIMGSLLAWVLPGILALVLGIVVNIGTIKKVIERRKLLRQIAQHLILVSIGFLYLFPFIWLAGSSFKLPGAFFSEGLNIIPKEIIFDNYPNAWIGGMFGIYFKNTAIITVSVVIGTVLIASMAAYTLTRSDFPGRKLLISLNVILMFMPAGYTLIPQYDLINALGLNNTLYAVIILATAGGLLWNSFLFMGYFMTIDKELEEAARVDGASYNQMYWQIMFPLAKPMIATVAIFVFIGNWNDFLLPLVFTLSKPELRTLAVGMYNFQSEHSTEWTLMCSGAIISITPITLVFLSLQGMFIESIQGAIKG